MLPLLIASAQTDTILHGDGSVQAFEWPGDRGELVHGVA
jgi:hypothetical protein